jgi:hypothetical protein
LSPSNSYGSWSQHRKTCKKLPEFLAAQQATPIKKRKAGKDAGSPVSSPEAAGGAKKQRKMTLFTVSPAQQGRFVKKLVLWAVKTETPSDGHA